MSGLTRKKIAVLELIRTCSEGVTSAEVMYSLGMSRSTVFFILDSLLKDNLIFRAHNETGRNSRISQRQSWRRSFPETKSL